MTFQITFSGATEQVTGSQRLLTGSSRTAGLFVRLYKLFEQGPDGFVPTSIEEVKENNAPLFQGLMLQDELPPGFKLLGELRVQDERDIPFARVVKVEREAE